MAAMTTANRFGLFLIAGGVSTVGHFLTLWVLREYVRLDLIVATTVGYLVGAVINYVMNRRLAFTDAQTGWEAVPRFSLVVVSGLVLNAMLMALMDYFAPMVSYLLRQCVATGMVLLSNFFLHKRWTFGVKNAGGSQ